MLMPLQTEISLRCVSAAASIEFAFAILEKLCGKEHTEKVKASIYYDARH